MRAPGAEKPAAGDVATGTHVWHLMRKNYRLKMRQWFTMSFGFLPMGFVFEFCLPFGIALLWSSLSHLAKINVTYTGWSQAQFEVPDITASTACPVGSHNCTPYTQDVATPAPFINYMVKMHWTHANLGTFDAIPVKIALAARK